MKKFEKSIQKENPLAYKKKEISLIPFFINK